MQKIENTNVFNSLFIEFCNISYLFNSVTLVISMDQQSRIEFVIQKKAI